MLWLIAALITIPPACWPAVAVVCVLIAAVARVARGRM